MEEDRLRLQQAALNEAHAKEQREQSEAAAREAAELARQEEMAQQQAEADRQRKSELLPAEPEEGAEGVFTVALRLPDGSKNGRRFMGEHTLAMVCLYAESLSVDYTPGSYQMVSSFPRKVFSDLSVQINNLGMGRNVMLILEELLDSSDEEAEEE